MIEVRHFVLFIVLHFAYVQTRIQHNLSVRRVNQRLIDRSRQDTLDMCRMFTGVNQKQRPNPTLRNQLAPNIVYSIRHNQTLKNNKRLKRAKRESPSGGLDFEEARRVESIVDNLYDEVTENGRPVPYRTKRLETTTTKKKPPNRRFNFAPNILEGPGPDDRVTNKTRPFGPGDANQPIPWPKKWKHGIVPYFIDPKTYDDALSENIIKAFDYIEKASCIRLQRLRERPMDQGSLTRVEWLYISNPSGIRQCVHSNEKKENKGVQMVIFGYDCLRVGDIVHEIMHILGFSHEHTRPDRNEHVSILWDNIKPGYKKYFEVRSEDLMMNLPYDYASVLHYPPRAFSKNGQLTIVAEAGVKVGQRDGLSETDVEKIGLVYGYECNDRNREYLLSTCPSVVKANDKPETNSTQEEITSYFDERLWPYGIVNFKLRDLAEFSIEERENIKAVIRHIEKETCIEFRDLTEYTNTEEDIDKAESTTQTDEPTPEETENTLDSEVTTEISTADEVTKIKKLVDDYTTTSPEDINKTEINTKPYEAISQETENTLDTEGTTESSTANEVTKMKKLDDDYTKTSPATENTDKGEPNTEPDEPVSEETENIPDTVGIPEITTTNGVTKMKIRDEDYTKTFPPTEENVGTVTKDTKENEIVNQNSETTTLLESNEAVSTDSNKVTLTEDSSLNKESFFKENMFSEKLFPGDDKGAKKGLLKGELDSHSNGIFFKENMFSQHLLTGANEGVIYHKDSQHDTEPTETKREENEFNVENKVISEENTEPAAIEKEALKGESESHFEDNFFKQNMFSEKLLSGDNHVINYRNKVSQHNTGATEKEVLKAELDSHSKENFFEKNMFSEKIFSGENTKGSDKLMGVTQYTTAPGKGYTKTKKPLIGADYMGIDFQDILNSERFLENMLPGKRSFNNESLKKSIKDQRTKNHPASKKTTPVNQPAQKHHRHKRSIQSPSRRHAQDILTLVRSAKPGCKCPKPGKPKGETVLEITNDCFNSVNDLLHLFVHVLGLDHQHNMHDRDSYLQIVWDKLTAEIKDEMKDKLPPAASVGFPYDYQSVMHYPWLQIKNGVTNIMYPIWNDGWAMGHWQGLSSTDVAKLNLLYSKQCTERKKQADDGITVKGVEAREIGRLKKG